MKSLRVVLASFASAALSIAMGQGVAMAQPPGSVAAGDYHTVVQQAGGFFFDPAAGSFLSINVTRTVSTASPKDGVSTTSDTASVSFNAFVNGTSTFGCFDIKPTDFTVGAGTAALHTGITSNNATCNPPFGVQPPYTIDVTWSSNAPEIRSHNDTQLACGGYGLETAETTLNQFANANVGISDVLPGTFAIQGNIASDDLTQHAHGVQPDNCQPFGATPGGAGPPPAGDYRTTTTTARFFVQNPGDFQPTLDVFINHNIQQSTPKVGPATSSDQFQVSIGMLTGGIFTRGCFDLTPADFTSSDATSATLSTTFTDNTQTCFPDSKATLPLPLTISIDWSGSGPVSTTHNTGDFTCQGYRNQGQGIIVTNNANVTATLTNPPNAPMTFTTTGTLATAQSNNHAEGTLGPPCPI